MKLQLPYLSNPHKFKNTEVMEAVTLSEARVYVGTYNKYNNGSLFGKWLDLSDYSDKDEFFFYQVEEYQPLVPHSSPCTEVCKCTTVRQCTGSLYNHPLQRNGS